MPAKSGGGGWVVLAAVCLLEGWACLSWESELAPAVGLLCVCGMALGLYRYIVQLERAQQRTRR